MDATAVRILERTNRRFPPGLAATSGMPDRLFVRGSVDALTSPHRLAVVGTRSMTTYGREMTERLVRPVASHGIVIVSGLALGIDAHAHRTCLDGNGTTIAVLGSGIDDDSIGPRSNLGLAHDILANGGALVSEYPPGTRAERWTFPARNRIISALSDAVLVIEAAVKSGALITARLAADQGRDVLAVPGSALWPRSEGTNMLIRDGAHVVTDASHVIAHFGLETAGAAWTGRRVVSTRNPLQASIVAILQDGPTTTDALSASLDTATSLILSELARLEIDGLVDRNGDGTYRIT